MITRTLITSVTAACCTALIACAPTKREADDRPDAQEAAADAEQLQPGCSRGADEVYTIDVDKHVYMFDPSSKTFVDLGELSCPAHGSVTNPDPTPYSMAVDRKAMAWVLYSSGELFKVDIYNQLACEPTAWKYPMSGELNTLFTFGMGFTRDTPSGDTDTLYIDGLALGDTLPMTLFVPKLAKLDTTTMSATYVATTIGTRQDVPAEMTGNANAELWGFFPDGAMPRVVQFDKLDGTFIKNFVVPEAARPNPGYAFAHWGGDYWIFVYDGNNETTSVYQVDGSTGAVKSTTAETGRHIVGAGVSTCAPIIIL